MGDRFTKKDLMRKKIALTNGHFPQGDRRRADESIAKRLLGMPGVTGARVVCSYVSLPDEVDTKKIITVLLTQKKTVVVPKIVREGAMGLYSIGSLDDLTPGVFDILEPKETCTEILPADVDLFIVPGIAFDRNGNRLGRGGGYYDRLLKNITVPIVALTYDFQVIAQVPHTSYDVPVTTIVTELKTIEISRGE